MCWAFAQENEPRELCQFSTTQAAHLLQEVSTSSIHHFSELNLKGFEAHALDDLDADAVDSQTPNMVEHGHLTLLRSQYIPITFADPVPSATSPARSSEDMSLLSHHQTHEVSPDQSPPNLLPLAGAPAAPAAEQSAGRMQ